MNKLAHSVMLARCSPALPVENLEGSPEIGGGDGNNYRHILHVGKEGT